MMRFLKAGGDQISVIRVGMVVAIVGITAFVVIGAVFFIDQSSRRRPYHIPPPQGAAEYRNYATGAAEQEIYYRIPMAQASIDEVVAHYTERLQALEGTDDVACQRFPAEGNFPDYVPGTTTVPYEYKCLFDRSSFNNVQVTEVLIQPGIDAMDTDSLVLIRYVQRWSR